MSEHYVKPDKTCTHKINLWVDFSWVNTPPPPIFKKNMNVEVFFGATSQKIKLPVLTGPLEV